MWNAFALIIIAGHDLDYIWNES